MFYDVTLPGHAPPTHLCPHLRCEQPFQGHFTRTDIGAWESALQQGEAAARAHLTKSGALTVQHTPTCPFRCLPPAVLALCSDDELIAQWRKALAVLDDC